MDHVVWHDRPSLRHPPLIAAFSGWNDAGDAASVAVRHLVGAWDGRRIAHVDAEEFFDFQTTRPTVRLIEGLTRQVEWPPNDLYAASTRAGDVLLLLGTEPQLRWRTFGAQIVGIAQTYGCPMVLTLGALLADVAHSRPVPLIGTGSDPELVERFGLQRSRYEGPTGIVGTLHDACGRAGIPSASLWAAVPAYAASTTSPKAALALVRRVSGIVQAGVDTSSMEREAIAYVAEVSELVAEDDDLVGYVHRLESMADEEDEDGEATGESGGIAEHDERSGEQLVEEVERFLRDQGE